MTRSCDFSLSPAVTRDCGFHMNAASPPYFNLLVASGSHQPVSNKKTRSGASSGHFKGIMAPNPGANTSYVYKIMDTAPPASMPASLPLSELDTKDGFIHLSDGKQIPITANLFFKDTPELWVLKISAAALKGTLK